MKKLSKTKKKPKYWLYVLIGLGILLIGGALFIFTFLKKPVVSSIDAKITRFGGTDTLPVLIKVKFFNPNFFDIPYDSIHYRIDINEKLKGFGALDKADVMESKKDKELELPLKVLFGPKYTPNGDSGAFEFHVNFFSHFGPFRIPIHYTLEKKLPVFKKIEVRLDSIIINSLKFKTTNISAVVLLSNINQIEFHSKKISYKFTIDNELIAEGELKVDTVLKPKSSLQLKLPIEVKSFKFLKYMVIAKKMNADKPFKLMFKINLERIGQGPSEKEINLEIERNGFLKELEREKGKKKTHKIKFK